MFPEVAWEKAREAARRDKMSAKSARSGSVFIENPLVEVSLSSFGE
jgi:hypothetical protein